MQVEEDLQQLGIKFVVKKAKPEMGAIEMSREAAITICDMGYLRHQKEWREKLASHAKCLLEMVESDVIIPVEEAYPKEAYSAAVLRPRIHEHLDEHLVVPRELWPSRDSLDLEFDSIDINYPGSILKDMDIDVSVQPVEMFIGGGGEANLKLHNFIVNKLDRYSGERNDPSKGIQSDLSPYLHFGQISPLFLTMKIMNHGGEGGDAFLEELIVRRELAMNHSHYNPHYDTFDCLPEWAITTLEDHSSDQREYTYSIEEMENAETHDPYWNAAQKEMVVTGKMHNYMRNVLGEEDPRMDHGPTRRFR